MLMGQAEILAADPGLECRLVSPRGEDHIGGLRIGRSEHLQAHKARLCIDLTRPGSEALLELLTPWQGDRNTVGDNVHSFLLAGGGRVSDVESTASIIASATPLIALEHGACEDSDIMRSRSPHT